MPMNGYGTMIIFGIAAAGSVGWVLTRRVGLNFYEFVLLATYAGALGVVGAKGAYLLLNVSWIDWDRFLELEYFSALMSGGFIFYGGIPLGLLGFWLAQKIHRIDGRLFLALGIPLLPLIHAFGRVGCFFAGCCFGLPYDGPLAVTYQRAYGAPVGVPLFPVQLLEAVVELAIFGLLLWLYLRGGQADGLLATYFLVYGTARFGLEYLRYDDVRGRFLWFSTSQWLSILCVLAAGAYFLCHVLQKVEPKKL